MAKAEILRELEAKKLKLRMKQIDLVSNCADRNDKKIRRQEEPFAQSGDKEKPSKGFSVWSFVSPSLMA